MISVFSNVAKQSGRPDFGFDTRLFRSIAINDTIGRANLPEQPSHIAHDVKKYGAGRGGTVFKTS